MTLPRLALATGMLLSAQYLGCASAGRSSPTNAGKATEACSVELWSLSWNADGSGGDLVEDSLAANPLTRRYRVEGCDYARSVRKWMDHASPLPPPAPTTGDIRLLARVTTGASSWLLAVPITCHWVRLDRTRIYRFDPALFALLARPLAEDERVAVQRFGGCGL
jgi:hypothetical protein